MLRPDLERARVPGDTRTLGRARVWGSPAARAPSMNEKRAGRGNNCAEPASVTVLPGAKTHLVAVSVGQHPEARCRLGAHQGSSGGTGGVDPWLDLGRVHPEVEMPPLPVGLAAGLLEPDGRERAGRVAYLVLTPRAGGLVQAQHGVPERPH